MNLSLNAVTFSQPEFSILFHFIFLKSGSEVALSFIFSVQNKEIEFMSQSSFENTSLISGLEHVAQCIYWSDPNKI